jgi:hypothetical protein
MPENKGKPSGKDSETKTGIGAGSETINAPAGRKMHRLSGQSRGPMWKEGIKNRTALSSAQNPVCFT